AAASAQSCSLLPLRFPPAIIRMGASDEKKARSFGTGSKKYKGARFFCSERAASAWASCISAKASYWRNEILESRLEAAESAARPGATNTKVELVEVALLVDAEREV